MRDSKHISLPFTLKNSYRKPSDFLLTPYLEPFTFIDTSKPTDTRVGGTQSRRIPLQIMAEARTQMNMRAYQMMLDIYMMHSRGKIPENLNLLEKDAKERGYWNLIDIENPFDPHAAAIVTMEDYLKTSIKPRGVVVYQNLAPEIGVSYLLLGTNANGQYIKNKTDMPLVLKN